MSAYLFWTTGVFVLAWGDPCRRRRAVAVLSATTVMGSCGQMSAHSADTGQQSGEKGRSGLESFKVEMGCEATMNFSLLEVQRRVSCAEGGRLHEPVRKGARCWRGSGCILTTGIWALNFCFSLSQRSTVPSRIQPCRYVQMVGTTHPCITPCNYS